MNNDKLLKEIYSTDRVEDNFIQSALTFANHEDKSNSSNFAYMKEQLIELLLDLDLTHKCQVCTKYHLKDQHHMSEIDQMKVPEVV